MMRDAKLAASVLWANRLLFIFNWLGCLLLAVLIPHWASALYGVLIIGVSVLNLLMTFVYNYLFEVNLEDHLIQLEELRSMDKRRNKKLMWKYNLQLGFLVLFFYLPFFLLNLYLRGLGFVPVI